jgi:hypothetical protein
MDTIEEEQHINELEHNLFEENIHSDNKILSLLVQREINYSLFKNICFKYNKPLINH